MNDTLGKRLAIHRKGLGLTQDQLAERLGVTAQAVSKWENDQSCPDITTLPRLAEIFDTTTDELLGVPPKEIKKAEILREDEGEEPLLSLRVNDDKDGKNFEFHYDAGRKGGIGLAVWVMVTAALLLFSESFYSSDYGFWDCLWPAGLLVFGLFGLYPKFSVFRLACALFGGYAVANLFFGVIVGRNLWLPLLLLLFGLSLLVDSLKKKDTAGIHIHGPKEKAVNQFDCTAETFECSTVFGRNHHNIPCCRLSRGKAEVVFGELTVDFGGCEEFSSNCTVKAESVFGSLRLLIPKGCRVVHTEERAFGSIDVQGHPDPEAAGVIYMDCEVSFGHIAIVYV